MKIELEEKTVREIVQDYSDNLENGVTGYGGRLNIRPAYQREFIYDDKRRNQVIDTVMRGFPLSIMYWNKTDDGNYELLDGQQRTVSVCKYVTNEFSVVIDGMPRTFANLTKGEQEQILDYKLTVYVCEGSDKERLDWFKTINIAGVELSDQELRNAIYTGPWLTEAKRHFSKTGCPAQMKAGDYLSGKRVRQEYLERALKWIANRDGIEIEDYMSQHQHDTNCNDLWLYFSAVIDWVQALFPNYRSIMKGLDWGILYNKYHTNSYDPTELEDQIKKLIDDEDVTKQSGIYPYLLSGEEKYLSIRAFHKNMARKAYERQGGICPNCKKHFEIEEMEADHITPWSKGGKTTAENCQMLCKECNRRKSDL